MRAAAGLAAVLIVGLAPSLAAAQAEDALRVSVTSVRAGDSVTISGAGCVVGAEVEIRFDGELVHNAEAATGGSFTSVLRIPAATLAGIHTISALCGASGTTSITLTARITVVAGPLAGTGTPAYRLLWPALLVLAAGAVLVLSSRHRAARA